MNFTLMFVLSVIHVRHSLRSRGELLEQISPDTMVHTSAVASTGSKWRMYLLKAGAVKYAER